MEVTELGIVMLVSPLHSKKTLLPITVTEFGIDMLVNSTQYPKAIEPMDVTEFGITMSVKLLQSANALSCTICKCIIAYICNGVGYLYVCQSTTAFESTPANECNRIGNFYAS